MFLPVIILVFSCVISSVDNADHVKFLRQPKQQTQAPEAPKTTPHPRLTPPRMPSRPNNSPNVPFGPPNQPPRGVRPVQPPPNRQPPQNNPVPMRPSAPNRPRPSGAAPRPQPNRPAPRPGTVPMQPVNPRPNNAAPAPRAQPPNTAPNAPQTPPRAPTSNAPSDTAVAGRKPSRRLSAACISSLISNAADCTMEKTLNDCDSCIYRHGMANELPGCNRSQHKIYIQMVCKKFITTTTKPDQCTEALMVTKCEKEDDCSNCLVQKGMAGELAGCDRSKHQEYVTFVCGSLPTPKPTERPKNTDDEIVCERELGQDYDAYRLDFDEDRRCGQPMRVLPRTCTAWDCQHLVAYDNDCSEFLTWNDKTLECACVPSGEVCHKVSGEHFSVYEIKKPQSKAEDDGLDCNWVNFKKEVESWEIEDFSKTNIDPNVYEWAAVLNSKSPFECKKICQDHVEDTDSYCWATTFWTSGANAGSCSFYHSPPDPKLLGPSNFANTWVMDSCPYSCEHPLGSTHDYLEFGETVYVYGFCLGVCKKYGHIDYTCACSCPNGTPEQGDQCDMSKGPIQCKSCQAGYEGPYCSEAVYECGGGAYSLKYLDSAPPPSDRKDFHIGWENRWVGFYVVWLRNGYEPQHVVSNFTNSAIDIDIQWVGRNMRSYTFKTRDLDQVAAILELPSTERISCDVYGMEDVGMEMNIPGKLLQNHVTGDASFYDNHPLFLFICGGLILGFGGGIILGWKFNRRRGELSDILTS